jgi:DNA-binding MarR family transcriptional regulator
MKKSIRATKKSPQKSTTKPAGESTQVFDDEGVRMAILAALECMYECFPHITLPQYLIALEVRKSERDGTPHTLASLVKKLRMPFSTASRVVWSLTEEGGSIGVIRYQSHPTDRRKKQLVINQKNLPNEVPQAVTRAMLDYYGDTVRQLRRAEA